MPRIIRGKSFYDKPWYGTYRSMMDRCHREKAKNYSRYGGRGRKERVMVKSTEATKAIAYHLFCDKCGEEMESTNLMLTCDPPRYEHRCPKCGNKDYPRKQYPYIAFEWAERSET